MEYIRKNIKIELLLILFVFNIFIWYSIFNVQDKKLTVALLDIGQGDAIFIKAPNGNQIIVDGGPDKSILRELGKVMPYYDNSIDAIVVTNPDADHYAGFIDVLKNYKVGMEFEPGTISNTATYKEFQKRLNENSVQKVLARRGMNIFLDDDTKLEILFPDRDVTNWKTNDGSIVAKLIYKNNSVLLMGDATKKTEGIIESLDGNNLKSDILKIGHHGSKTSTGADLLVYSNPNIAIISAGLKNKYGHPSPETINILDKFKIPHLVTFEEGTIIFMGDGETFERVK